VHLHHQRAGAGVGEGHDLVDAALEALAERSDLHPQRLARVEAYGQGFANRHLEAQRARVVDLEQRRAGGGGVAGLGQAVHHAAAHRRADHREGEAHLGVCQALLGGLEVGMGHVFSRLQAVELLRAGRAAGDHSLDAFGFALRQLELGAGGAHAFAGLARAGVEIAAVEQHQLVAARHHAAGRHLHRFDARQDLRGDGGLARRDERAAHGLAHRPGHALDCGDLTFGFRSLVRQLARLDALTAAAGEPHQRGGDPQHARGQARALDEKLVHGSLLPWPSASAASSARPWPGRLR
jgi:hypothetical protein